MSSPIRPSKGIGFKEIAIIAIVIVGLYARWSYSEHVEAEAKAENDRIAATTSAQKTEPATGHGPTTGKAPKVETPTKVDTTKELEECREKLKQAQRLEVLHNMTFDGGRPKVWVGKTWHQITIDAKVGFAETAACFFLGGDATKRITFPIYDGYTGKQLATWKFTRLTD